MKLYFSPGACSLSPHIVLLESGLKFDTERVNLATKRTAGGDDYYTINPKGYVPALELDDGQLLTEGPAIVQYLADLVPDKRLAPRAGTMERYRLMEWLNFIASEIHKAFGPLFKAQSTEASKQAARDVLAKRFDFVSQRLQLSSFLGGEQFSVADAYLFTVLHWCSRVGIDLGRWPALQAYQTRIANRPAVYAALMMEGQIQL